MLLHPHRLMVAAAWRARLLGALGVLVCALLLPGAAAGAAHGRLTGRITYVGASTLTIQTNGHSMGVINALTRSADAVAAGVWPYVWGGGHDQAGQASVGGRGPGYNGRRRGFDCSGSVAAVLSGAGLWPAGSGVPNDLGVVRQLLAEHVIARGPGQAPTAVNLYDRPGVHIFMSIDGRFFGTSDGGGGNRKGGPTWLDDGAWDSYNRSFRRYHVLPAVLRSTTTYGHSYTFQTFSDPALTLGAELGDKVTVDYAPIGTGSMRATALTFTGLRTLTGTVTALSGSALTVQQPSGSSVVFATSLVSSLLSGVAVGDGVQVTYTRDSAGLLIPHVVQVTSTPAPVAPAPPSDSAPAPPPGSAPAPPPSPATGPAPAAARAQSK
ncbi:MAG TPA: hypothetical protein VFN55_08040 [Solirubrobacteraceae bacterium]|nr:hypothetical protein [Solirubrobacteraceae bacterium]